MAATLAIDLDGPLMEEHDAHANEHFTVSVTEQRAVAAGSGISVAAPLVFIWILLSVSVAIAWAAPAHAANIQSGEPNDPNQTPPTVLRSEPDANNGSHSDSSGRGLAAQVPPDDDLHPSFTVDPGGHVSLVRGVAFLPDGKRLVSTGYDKTIRIWDIAEGQTVQRILGETWPTPDGGSIYAMALTPDGRTLAVAGQMCADKDSPDPNCGNIRVFNTATGEQERVLSGHKPGIILALSASPDGGLLASAASFPDATIKVWSLADGKEVAGFAYPGGGHRYNKVVFLADGQHVAASSDTDAIHVFKIGTSEPVAILQASEQLSAIAASADGKLIAAGSVSGSLRVWSWPEHTVVSDVGGNGATASALAFGNGTSADWVATGASGTPFVVRVLNARTGAAVATYERHDNTISALAFSGDGMSIASAGGSGHVIHIWSAASAKLEQSLGGRTSAPYAVGFIRESGTDGTPVEHMAWGFADPCPDKASCPEEAGELQFSIQIPGPSGGIISRPEPWPRKVIGARRPGPPPEITRAVIAADHIRISRLSLGDPIRFPQLSVGLDGGPKATVVRGPDRGKDHISYSLSPDGTMLASGSRNGTLETFTLDGKLAKRLLGHTGDIWALAYNHDGRLLITGAGDQTVRLWNPATGELIVSLVHLPESGDWVMWTPQGYFAASPEGEHIVSAIVQRGEGKPQEVVTPQQVNGYFYRPEIVRRAIEMASAEAAVTWGRAQAIISDFRLENLRSVPIGRFNIFEPKNGTTTNQGHINVSIARTIEGTEGSEYTVYVNGNKVQAARTASHWYEMPAESFDVPLHNGTNTIMIQAETPNRLYAQERVQVVQQGPGPLDTGSLYILAIGIDHYEKLKNCRADGCDLHFAGKDAVTFANLAEQQMGLAYQKGVQKKVLFTGAGGDLEPTRDNIDNALNMFLSAKDNDTSVLFVAGHGTNLDPRGYLLLASDSERAGATFNNAISWVRLQEAIKTPRGRKIMFLDTCRSSAAYGFDLQINPATRQQISLYLATLSDQDAIEDQQFGGGHGAFTYALEQGLQLGEADLEPDHRIMADELGRYTRDKVFKLTHERQEPYHWNSLGVRDYELVRLH